VAQHQAQSVAVLGTGTMAPGIAVTFAAAGHATYLWGRNPERLRGALSKCREMAHFLEANGLSPPASEVADRIEALEDLGDAAERAHVVVEAVTENLEIKRRVFAEMDRLCAPTVMLATNTSGLRVSDIATKLTHQHRVVAMHFWNPAHLMPVVEVAGGERTASEIVTRARDLATAIGKVPVVLREVLGFLGTRLQQAVVREAIALLEAGVASAEDIDLAVRTSFGARFPVIGPLESADLSGLDVIEAVHRYLLSDLDRSVEPQSALTTRVARGDLGVKSGRGFHDWTTRDATEVVRRRDEELVRRLTLLETEGLVRLPRRESTNHEKIGRSVSG
jgi:3-hydroxybutyryl-CoA dehydrogenase